MLRRRGRWAVRACGIAVFVLASCGGRGDKQTGDPCADANECQAGLCVGGSTAEAPTCTVSCASTDDCPRGWACSGVTENNVLVCSHGAPTPFGIGARE